MGRLIDESLLQEKLALIPMEERTFRRTVEELENAPTVEIHIDAIPIEHYKARLKADMVVMLTELKHELTNISWNIDMYDSDLDFECCYLSDINKVIQQKIDKLK